MSNKTDWNKNRDDLSVVLNQKFPGLLDGWNDISRNVETEITEEVKTQFKENFGTIESLGELNISVVLDNNFVFGQIKAMVTKGTNLEDTFIFRLLNSVFVSVHAPYKLQEELYAKIDKYLEAETTAAYKYAEYILSKIKLLDAYWTDDWKKANQQIGSVDEDDVPYLALAISIGSHAIISRDKIFQLQSETSVWTIGETDRIMTTFNKGALSFSLIGLGVVTIEGLYRLLSVLVKAIIEVIKELVTALVQLFQMIFKMISKIPPELGVIILGITLLYIFSSEEFRQKGMVMFDKIKNNAKEYLQDLIEDLKHFKNQLIELWEIFKPVGITSAQVIFFLSLEIFSMIEELEKLSKKAPDSLTK